MNDAMTSTPPPMRVLFFHTSAVLKDLFHGEGSDVVRWMRDTEATICYSVHCVTSKHVRDEVLRVLHEKEQAGIFCPNDAKSLYERAEDYFEGPGGLDLVDASVLPNMWADQHTSAEDLLKKHQLCSQYRPDCEILASLMNCLRYPKGGSLPHVVMADKDFSKVVVREGLRVINPETMSIEDVKTYLRSLGAHEI